MLGDRPAADSIPHRLSVELRGRELHARLEPGGLAGVRRPIEGNQPVDPAVLRALRVRAHALLQIAAPSRALVDAHTCGVMLYRTLVPPPLRTPLRALSGALLLTTPLEGVPWELLHDGNDFWGVRYALARTPPGRPAFDHFTLPFRRAGPLRVLCVGDDSPENEGTIAVLRALCVTRGGELYVAQASSPAFDATVRTILMAGVDVLHCIGLGWPDEEGNRTIAIGGRTMASSILTAGGGRASVVFLNTRRNVHTTSESLLGPVIRSLLAAGTRGIVVGSSSCPPALVAAFYRNACSPLPLGEALLHARRELGNRESPAVLGVSLYSSPTLLVAPTPLARPNPVSVDSTRSVPPQRRGRVGVLTSLCLLAAIGLVVRWRHPTPQVSPPPPPPPAVGVLLVRTTAYAPAAASLLDETFWDMTTVLAEVARNHPGALHAVVFDPTRASWCASGTECVVARSSRPGVLQLRGTLTRAHPDHLKLHLRVVAHDGRVLATRRAVGPLDSLFSMQAALTIDVLRALGVPIRQHERARMLAHRRPDLSFHIRRALLNGLRGSLLIARPHGTRDDTLPRDPNASRMDAERGIATLLHDYRQAARARDADLLASLQHGMGARQHRAMEEYFRAASVLRTKLSRPRLVVQGGEALVHITRTDQVTWWFTNVPVTLVTDMLLLVRERSDGAWFIVSQRVPPDAKSLPAAIEPEEPAPATTASVPTSPEFVLPGIDDISICNFRGCVLYGDSGANVLTGGPYTDVLSGGSGNDLLTGSYGTDLFAFVTRRSLAGSPDGPRFGPLVISNSYGSFPDLGIDTVSDFTPGIDHVGLEAEVFQALIRPGGGVFLTESDLSTCESDEEALAGFGASYLKYSTASGLLYYDSNGPMPGLSAGGPFAILVGTPPLSFRDVVLLYPDWDDTPRRWQVPPVSSSER